MRLELTTTPDDADAKALSEGIRTFNHGRIPDLESESVEVRFFVFVRDATGRVCGGLRAECYWNTLHIELLWLSDDCRGSGVGMHVIAIAEARAIELGCLNAFVETTSWQAKPFYEKAGYTLVATLKDRPIGHASHYLTKVLNPIDT